MAAKRVNLEKASVIAGLGFTVLLAWAGTALSHSHRFNPGMVVVALFWGLLAALALRLTVPVRAWWAAVWYAPAMLLLFDRTALTFAAGLALLLATSRLLAAPEEEAPRPFRELATATAIAAGFQCWGVATSMEYPVLGIGLLAVSTAALAGAAIRRVAGMDARRRRPRHFATVCGIAMVVGLLTAVQGSGSGSWFSFGFSSSRGEAPEAEAAAAARAAAGTYRTAGLVNTAQEEPPVIAPREGFPGVILWPEIKPVPVLVAPLTKRAGAFTGGVVRSLSIPFGGEYWIYRFPLTRPPAHSYFRRGSAAKLSFSAPDRCPLRMEARQRLVQPVSTRCCSSIRLEIRNADPWPATVSLEVQLANTERPTERPQSLGWQTVMSMPKRGEDPVQPVPETLEFSIPEGTAAGEFDEIVVTYHLGRRRVDRSARIAIDRFVLVP
jgi:hypothetical protein